MIDNIKCLCEVQEQPINIFWSLLAHLNLGHINKVHLLT